MLYGTLVNLADHTKAYNLLQLASGSVAGAGHASQSLLKGLSINPKNVVLQWNAGVVWIGDSKVAASDSGYTLATGLPPIVLSDDRGISIGDLYAIGTADNAKFYLLMRD